MCPVMKKKNKKKQQVLITIESSNKGGGGRGEEKRKGIALFETGPPPRKSQELSQHDWECNAQRRRANTTAVDTYTNANYHK